MVAPVVSVRPQALVRAEPVIAITPALGFFAEIRRKSPNLRPKALARAARIHLPDHPIKTALKPRRGLVQQQVSRAEFLPELYLLESLHQPLRFFFRIRICARTFQMIVNRFPQGLPAQPPVAQPEHRSGERGMAIDHDAQRAAGLQYAARLANAPSRIGAVMHDPIRIDNVESIIGKGQMLGIGLAQIGYITRQFAAPPRPRERRTRHVYSRCHCAGLQPFQVVRSHSDANFEHTLSRRLPKSGKLPDVRAPIHNAPARALRNLPARPPNRDIAIHRARHSRSSGLHFSIRFSTRQRAFSA